MQLCYICLSSAQEEQARRGIEPRVPTHMSPALGGHSWAPHTLPWIATAPGLLLFIHTPLHPKDHKLAEFRSCVWASQNLHHQTQSLQYVRLSMFVKQKNEWTKQRWQERFRFPSAFVGWGRWHGLRPEVLCQYSVCHQVECSIWSNSWVLSLTDEVQMASGRRTWDDHRPQIRPFSQIHGVCLTLRKKT